MPTTLLRHGNTQPAGCSASTFSGVYTFHGTGFALTGTAVSGVENALIAAVRRVSNATVNVTMSASGATPARSRSRIVYDFVNCLGRQPHRCGRQLLRDELSIYNSSVANGAAYVGLARSSKFWSPECKRHLRPAGGDRRLRSRGTRG